MPSISRPAQKCAGLLIVTATIHIQVVLGGIINSPSAKVRVRSRLNLKLRHHISGAVIAGRPGMAAGVIGPGSDGMGEQKVAMAFPFQEVLRPRRQAGRLLPLLGPILMVIDTPNADFYPLDGRVVYPALVVADGLLPLVPAHGHLPGVERFAGGAVQCPSKASHPAVER